MENYFTFVDSTSVAYAYSARKLNGIVTASTSVVLHFANVAGGTADLDADEVALTVTAGTERAVMLALLKQAKSGVLMVADDAAGEYFHADVTAVAVTLQA